MDPELTVVVVSWNTRGLLRRALTSVSRACAGTPHEVIVVDNASHDGSAAMVAGEFPQARLLAQTENLGFGRANNVGLRLGRGRRFLLLNSDAWLPDDSLLGLLPIFTRDASVGVVGPRLVYDDGRLQPSAYRFPTLGRLLLSELWLHRLLPRARAAAALRGLYWDHAAAAEVDWVSGACWLLERRALEAAGGFDESIFLYGEEMELSRRIRLAGFKVLYRPEATVVHSGHASTDLLLGRGGRVAACLQSEDRLLDRWHGRAYGLACRVVRLAGALLRLALFAPRSGLYARDVSRAAGEVARYYLRMQGATS